MGLDGVQAASPLVIHSTTASNQVHEQRRAPSVQSSTSSAPTNGGAGMPAPQRLGSSKAILEARGRKQSLSGSEAGDKKKPLVLESSDTQAEYMQYQLLQSVSQMASDSLSRWEQAASSIGDQLSKLKDIPQTVR